MKTSLRRIRRLFAHGRIRERLQRIAWSERERETGPRADDRDGLDPVGYVQCEDGYGLLYTDGTVDWLGPLDDAPSEDYWDGESGS
jgi:hypothetical protein